MKYLKDKIEEINSRNISEEEKQKQIDMLYEEEIKESNKSTIKIVIGGLIFIVVIISTIIVENFTVGIDFNPFEILVLLSAFIISFSVGYHIYRNFKRTTYKKEWKDLINAETSSLQILCEEISNNYIDEIKIKRNKVLISKGIFLFITIGLLIFYFIISNKISNIVMFVYFFVYGILLVYLYKNLQKNENQYKILVDEILSRFIKNISEELEYNEKEIEKTSIKSDYMYIGWDNVRKDDIEIENYICGEICNQTHMQMANVKYYTYKDYRGRNRINEWFTGSFISLYMNRNFECSKILLNKLNVFDRNELINSENSKFNKYFEIHASNKQKVQQYLTDDIINYIAEFREKYKIDFEIIFKDKIYIRFYTKNMFKPKMKGKIVDEYSIYQFYVITKFVKELVAKLNIN